MTFTSIIVHLQYITLAKRLFWVCSFAVIRIFIQFLITNASKNHVTVHKKI